MNQDRDIVSSVIAIACVIFIVGAILTARPDGQRNGVAIQSTRVSSPKQEK